MLHSKQWMTVFLYYKIFNFFEYLKLSLHLESLFLI